MVKPVAVLYEHPEWFKPLFAELARRGIAYEAIHAPRHVFDPGERESQYVVNARDGLPYFYDVNALSNFVADAPNVVGFDPFVNLVDLIERRARIRVPTAA